MADSNEQRDELNATRHSLAGPMIAEAETLTGMAELEGTLDGHERARGRARVRRSLHRRRAPRRGRHGHGHAITQATVDGEQPKPSEHAPKRAIPPELDRIVVRATALDPEDRFADVRALHEALEAFFDGQRDEELRRESAARHIEYASALLDREPGRRRDAIQALARALALNPGTSLVVSGVV